jgi:hypothetical protein
MKFIKFHPSFLKCHYFLLLLFAICNTQIYAANNTFLFYKKECSSVKFAVGEVSDALKKYNVIISDQPISFVGKLNIKESNLVFLNLNDKECSKLIQANKIKKTSELKSEGFLIYRSSSKDKTIWIIGYDEAGLMYGGLEVAEIIKIKGVTALQTQLQNPYMSVRGSKFNIPLDMRSPTYTEPSDAAQKNMAEMWDFEFWKEYIDNLARYRYNLVSLWNMHPFPSMVKVPEYPNVALEDVRKSTGLWKENYSLNGWGFDAPEIMKSFEVIKKMTIDEKIDFWRKVMAYGKQRNVNFYIITWNIFTYGIDGKYGITDKAENSITTDYFRKSVKQMVLSYPDLAGIGLTTGENMYDYSATQKEEWAYATYGQGVLDALKEQPNRKINFIHRQHQSKASEITKIFKGITENKNINFLFSFKYAQAHVYSSVNQVFHQDFVKDIQSEKLKTLWTLRNDDVFYFRWGAPDFVRDFIKNIPQDVSEGYYYGSDQYVWGRDFLTKNKTAKGELELSKHWYQWMCWGRLGYNPNMTNSRFIDIIQSKFPSVNGSEIFNAWQGASMIYPLVTGFHWGSLDFQWYIESGQSQPSVSKTPSGYHDLNNFITLKPHKGTDNIAIPDYVKAFLSNAVLNGTTPLQVAENINMNANIALDWAEKQSLNTTPELRLSIEDIKAMAYLGKYYAHKIKAATYLQLFRETLKREWQDQVFEELNISAGYWRSYATIGISNYQNPLWTNRVGKVDWKENFKWALYEITSNGGKMNLPSMNTTVGGIILEAEDACDSKTLIETKLKGFTGKGYVGNGDGHDRILFNWKFNAPVSGDYILEFRYTLDRDEEFPAELDINGKKVGVVEFWNTGSVGTWVWDRITVKLDKGENLIAISPEKYVILDHLNLIKINN